MTAPETTLWSLLRRKQLAHLRFRRQHPFGQYILDFYCASARLCVEVDGPAHAAAEQIAHDAARTRWLQNEGITVLRVTIDDLDNHSARVLAQIAEAAAPSTA